MTQGSDFGSNSADIEAFIIGLMGPIPCKDVQVVSPVEDFNSCIECTTPDGVGKSNSCRIVANGVADTKKSCFAYGGRPPILSVAPDFRRPLSWWWRKVGVLNLPRFSSFLAVRLNTPLVCS